MLRSTWRTLAAALLIGPSAAGQAEDQTLFVAGGAAADVSVLRIGVDGVPAEVAGSPFPLGGTGVTALDVSRDGAVLAVVRDVAGAPADLLHWFNVAPDGALAEGVGSPVEISEGGFSIFVKDVVIAERSGRAFVYVYTGSASVHAFEVVGPAGNAVLVTVPGSPFGNSGLLLLGHGRLAATPDEQFLYGSLYNSGLVGYARADDGSLDLIIDAADVPGIDVTDDVVVSPDSRHLYVIRRSIAPLGVLGYTISADGLLEPVPGGTFISSVDAPGESPGHLAMTPDGNSLIVSNTGSDTLVALERLDDGALAIVAESSTPFPADLHGIATDGTRVFAAHFDPGDIFDPPSVEGVFAFGLAGDLTFTPVAGGALFAAGALPTEIALFTPQGDAPCPGDLEGDGSVGITDLLALLAAWGTSPGGPPDLDGDGTVGIADFLALLAAWGPCP